MSGQLLFPAEGIGPGNHRSAFMEGKEPSKILDIERLRGVAILLIVIEHLYLSTHLLNRLGIHAFRKPFWLSVELFFVISGFVVTKSFLSKQMSFRAFYLRRIFRLWPAVFVFFAFIALINLLPTPAQTSWSKLLAEAPSILFGYYTLRTEHHALYTGVMWSLSVEEQFYLVSPAVLFLGAWLFRNARRASLCVFFTFVLIVGVLLRFTWFYGPGLGLGWAMAWVPRWCWQLDFMKFDFLALGVILFFRTRRPTVLSEMNVRLQQVLAWLALIGPFVLMFRLTTSADVTQCPASLTFGMLAAGLGFYISVGLASLDRDLYNLGGLFDRWLLYLGSRSYSLYIFHFPAFMVPAYIISYAAPFLQMHLLMYSLIHAQLFLLVVLPVVEFTYRCVEQPMIRLGGRIIRRMQAPARKPVGRDAAVPVVRAA